MRKDMMKKISKALLSVVLCATLLPLVEFETAWADELSLDDAIQPQEEEGQEEALEAVEPNELKREVSGEAVVTKPKEAEPAGQLEETANEGYSIDLMQADDELAVQSAKPPTAALEYRTHVQSIGWQNWVKGGKQAGTTGRALRAEAINIRLANSNVTGSIEYRTHVQGAGWQNWVKDGALSGTTGKALRFDILNVRLTGELAQAFDVQYRVHSAQFGWLGWTANGGHAGTSGYGHRIEALEIKLVPLGSATVETNAFVKRPMTLEAHAHVQKIGWQGWRAGGDTAGTTGRALRMEALRLRIASPEHSGSIEYRTHVQGIGWQPWVKDGADAGTTGRSLRVEAIQIRLTGQLASHYEVFYRVHSAGVGWLGWTSGQDGSMAGTVGFSCRVEAIQVRLIPHGDNTPFLSAGPPSLDASLSAQAHVAGRGWLSTVSARATVGTTKQSRQLQAYKLNVSSNVSGGIQYNSYVQGQGWQGWVSNGTESGIANGGKRVEAIRIRLTGQMAQYFDVYYRAHSANWGWLGWARNGSNSGTTTLNSAMEAFQVVLVIKGSPAPGQTSGAYWEAPPLTHAQFMMNSRVAGRFSPTNWLLAIDSGNCLVGVYRKTSLGWVNQYFWVCSPGLPQTPTVKGTFSVGSRGYVFGNGFSCYWWTQFYGDYLFHSVSYYQGTFVVKDGRMGVPASAGCVRLDLQNAKWIYDNIPSGTTVISY
ncbi:MAG: L,D-transpeptidase family protein [Coriobacteriia bacterium]|nr:L,D-transpeptidase family protein [Coriobacteriia bacterium]